MIREVLGSAVQKKFYLMFFTCVIYILGLVAYFNELAIPLAFFITVVGIFVVLKNYLPPKLVLFWYFVFFFAFFNANFRMKTSDALYQIAPQNALIQGQIISIPAKSGNKIKFFFEVSKINYNGQEKNIKAKTLLNVERGQFNIGDFYKFQGKLRAPLEATNPSQFDYARYLRNFDIFTVFYADNFDYKKINKHLPLKWKFLQATNNIRNQVIQTHSKCLKSPNLELLGGIVFGDDAVSTPEDIKESFKHSGLLHILAASGMNVALIYGIWFFILRRFKVPFNLTVSSGIFIVIFYSIMAGLGPSVVRAAIMLIFVLIGKLIDRDAHSISLLSFVALLMLVYNPAYINDVGFQLSFIVTFGLLVMTPVVFEKNNGIPNWIKGAVFVPIIAQIWVAPIQMYYFNSFSLYSVLANIAILPFITVISFGGFISAVLALIKPISSQICFIFDVCLNPFLNCLVWISDYFANLPHSLIQTPQPNGWQILLYYGIILLSVLLIKLGKNKKPLIWLSSLLFVLIFSCIPFKSHSFFETIFFDVGNADAILIKTPKDKYFLIDSGKIGYKGGKTQAKMVILEYLKDKGVKNIEGLIITHFDSDHAGGACDLINNLNIKTVYVNSLEDKSNLARKIYQCAKGNVKLTQNNQMIYQEGKLTFKTFFANLKKEEFENENSIITLVSDGNFDEIFMGDAGVIAFNEVKTYLPQKIEVLKVGHHGAKNVVDKAFLDRVNPDFSIISTGINNYGHPNVVTLNLLENHGSKILRTDYQGAIKIDEKNGTYKAISNP